MPGINLLESTQVFQLHVLLKYLQNCILRLCLLRNAQNYVKWCVVVDVLFLLLCVFSGVRHILHLLQRIRSNCYHYLACVTNNLWFTFLNLLRLADLSWWPVNSQFPFKQKFSLHFQYALFLSSHGVIIGRFRFRPAKLLYFWPSYHLFSWFSIVLLGEMGCQLNFEQ